MPFGCALGAGQRAARKGGVRQSREPVRRHAALAGSALCRRRRQRLAVSVRTRFAPSPTGYLHIGGARTALFSWAYARRHGGKFILRVEDTDLERSTGESVNAILEGMKWLGLDWDEGPFFQMQRLARYREVADQLIASGHAYYDYMSREELEALRKEQLARGEKPRYDGRWRPERAKGKTPPKDRPPVIRFRTPEEGEVGWHDLVKGPIAFPNSELDDLVLLRADGVPTYNFGVVVDDLDMDITHVIRGDDPRRRRRAALEAPRCGQRHAIPRRRLFARGGRELPCASRLVSRRRGDVLERISHFLV